MSEGTAPAAPVTPAVVETPDQPDATGVVAPKAGTAPAPPAAEPQLYEVKVKGKAKRLTLPQVLALAQKSEGAEEAFRVATETQKKNERLLKELTEDPSAVLARLGIDPDKMLGDYVARKAKADAMTPEQRERQQLEAELKTLKAEKEKQEKSRVEAEQKTQDEATARRLESTLLAEAKRKSLPGTPENLDLLCAVAIEAIEHGYEPTAAQIVDEVLERRAEELKAHGQKLLPALSDEELLAHVGQERLKKLLTASLKGLPSPGKRPAASAAEVKVEKPQRGYITPSEFMRDMNGRFTGRG